MILSYCSGGELFFHLRKMGPLSEEASKQYFVQIQQHEEKRAKTRGFSCTGQCWGATLSPLFPASSAGGGVGDNRRSTQ